MIIIGIYARRDQIKSQYSYRHADRNWIIMLNSTWMNIIMKCRCKKKIFIFYSIFENDTNVTDFLISDFKCTRQPSWFPAAIQKTKFLAGWWSSYNSTIFFSLYFIYFPMVYLVINFLFIYFRFNFLKCFFFFFFFFFLHLQPCSFVCLVGFVVF